VTKTKTTDVWLVRTYGEIELFTRKDKPEKDAWREYYDDPAFSFCDAEFRRAFGFLGMRDGQAPKRFRITIEEIE